MLAMQRSLPLVAIFFAGEASALGPVVMDPDSDAFVAYRHYKGTVATPQVACGSGASITDRAYRVSTKTSTSLSVGCFTRKGESDGVATNSRKISVTGSGATLSFQLFNNAACTGTPAQTITETQWRACIVDPDDPNSSMQLTKNLVAPPSTLAYNTWTPSPTAWTLIAYGSNEGTAIGKVGRCDDGDAVGAMEQLPSCNSCVLISAGKWIKSLCTAGMVDESSYTNSACTTGKTSTRKFEKDKCYSSDGSTATRSGISFGLMDCGGPKWTTSSSGTTDKCGSTTGSASSLHPAVAAALAACCICCIITAICLPFCCCVGIAVTIISIICCKNNKASASLNQSVKAEPSYPPMQQPQVVIQAQPVMVQPQIVQAQVVQASVVVQ